MRKKLTVTIDEDVYNGLHRVIGRRKISGFIEGLLRPHVVSPDMELAYAEKAANEQAEREALQWAEQTFMDISDETV